MPFLAPEDVVNADGVSFQVMTSMRKADAMTRNARRNSMVRANHVRSEFDSQIHQRGMPGEVRRLTNNPVLLAKASTLRPATKRNRENE